MAPTTRSKQSTPAPEATTSSADIIGTPSSALGEIKQRPREGSRTRPREEVVEPQYALDLATTTVDENVFLFYPNLIGYSRVILAGVSLYYMPTNPNTCFVTYGLSCLLDAVDGQVARAFGQTSKFGAVLDMVTDRCTTACLLCFLSNTYKSWSLIFMFLITLDFSSHYIHMYSSLVTGSSSHKTVTSDVSRILWYYYNDSRTLFVFCFANELFFVCLYMAGAASTPKPIHSAFPVSLFIDPLDLARMTPQSIWWILSYSWPFIGAVLCFPIMMAKQIINVVQFWKASKILVGVDLVERQLAREVAAGKRS